MLKFLEVLTLSDNPSTEIFPHFLVDPNEYRESQLFWESKIETIIQSIPDAEPWHRWSNSTYADGTTELDGNPIFDGISESHVRAFRIIQHKLIRQSQVEVVAWIKGYDIDLEDFPEHELVINWSLTHNSAASSTDLLRSWMNPRSTIEDVQDLIYRLKPPL
jgi:hypothetical protein